MESSNFDLEGRLCAAADRRVVTAPLDLLAFIGEQMDFLTDTVGPDLKIVVNDYGRGFKVLAETVMLQLALFEILINARTSMPNGGTVTFTIVPLVIKEDIFLHDGDYMRMSIRDKGIGFSVAALANVFRDSGARDKRSGLVGVAENLEGWGGAVRVTARRSRGTTVHLYLRRAIIH